MLGQLQSARASNYMQTRQHSIRSLRWKLFERMVGHVKLGKLFHMEDNSSSNLRGRNRTFLLPSKSTITFRPVIVTAAISRVQRNGVGDGERHRRKLRLQQSMHFLFLAMPANFQLPPPPSSFLSLFEAKSPFSALLVSEEADDPSIQNYYRGS